MSKSWFTVPATTSGKILKASIIHPCWWNGASENARRKAMIGANIMALAILLQMYQINKLENQLTEALLEDVQS